MVKCGPSNGTPVRGGCIVLATRHWLMVPCVFPQIAYLIQQARRLGRAGAGAIGGP